MFPLFQKQWMILRWMNLAHIPGRDFQRDATGKLEHSFTSQRNTDLPIYL